MPRCDAAAQSALDRAARAILRRARGLLAEHGVCFARLRDRAGRLCSLSAIDRAAAGNAVAAYRACQLVLAAGCADDGWNVLPLSAAIQAWHDDNPQDPARILAGFDRAIAAETERAAAMGEAA
jgi:hypothetical protein